MYHVCTNPCSIARTGYYSNEVPCLCREGQECRECSKSAVCPAGARCAYASTCACACAFMLVIVHVHLTCSPRGLIPSSPQELSSCRVMLGWLVGRAQAKGGLSKGFLVGWLGTIGLANIAYRVYTPQAALPKIAPTKPTSPPPSPKQPLE